ncbi:MAG TPA: type II toxin-antitoxin system HipA family toxin [Polyangiaceae bacterium]|nr:type II toxin-antitoxin system HipA family toxin [Polyangiaceae bacterium]
MTVAAVRLWGRQIGAVSLGARRSHAAFQYTPEFVASGIQVSPLVMPLDERVYEFPALPRATFRGLPGLLADSLPDRFGNALIDAWLASEGRTKEDFDAVERLSYTGARGMGALEYEPAVFPRDGASRKLQVEALVALASEVLSHREKLVSSFSDSAKSAALSDMLKVGTSAGGGRAKAVIAWNPDTNEARSGQVRAPEGFSYWLLKFDGVTGNRDRELEDPTGYSAIEFAYSLMAKAAGIQMTECRLLEENGRRHFMTKRFDRGERGEKVHMQTLGALAHLDFNAAGAHSYEEAFGVMRRLGLPMDQVEQLFRRMLFNVVARNQDDHVKNIAFLMDKAGRWRLSPAFDVTYAYDPSGTWTSTHQMTLNGKRDGFSREDFVACGKVASLKRGRAIAMLEEVTSVVKRWAEFAERGNVAAAQAAAIGRVQRTGLG